MADLDESLTKLKKLQRKPSGLTSDEWQTIQKGVDELRERRQKEPPFDHKKYKATTQSQLAILFIRWYFWIIVAVLMFVFAYNVVLISVNAPDTSLVDVEDVFMMVSGAVTPILAFVLGHYFKGRD